MLEAASTMGALCWTTSYFAVWKKTVASSGWRAGLVLHKDVFWEDQGQVGTSAGKGTGMKLPLSVKVIPSANFLPLSM